MALGTVLHDYRFQDATASKFVNLLRSLGLHQSQLIHLLNGSYAQAITNRYGCQSPIFALLFSAYARGLFFELGTKLEDCEMSKRHAQMARTLNQGQRTRPER
jgi:hypothetical protein